MGKNDRFQVIYSQGTMDVIRVLLDTETGVLYLQVSNGYAGGLTPLLDGEGKPMQWSRG
ncbi:MAG TPA: hypothetical protein H9714_05695 [Candidatus Flavonifractor intestinipullorum]|uniref:DUF6440 domain-containing protein n=1 Tax=Candidatus Flavonifractor intestinipullorum TaxID=2838587 RepID=A0A9D2MBQ6_9FIRM|nr:hypothetical protein [Candidatus Flavonifractor intestinipullorum]